MSFYHKTQCLAGRASSPYTVRDVNAAMPHSLLVQTMPREALEDPGRLADEAESAVAVFFHEGFSRNTARTYKTALQYWGTWHALRYGETITSPVSSAVVIQFISDHLRHQPGVPAA